MARPVREQWDALAPIWERFEMDGLRPEHLAALDSELESPCAVIGSGLGLLCEGLREAGVESVVGVDFSPVMVQRSRRLRNVEAQVGRVDALPFGAAELASAVVATGVLDCGDPGALRKAWAELARVVRPGGTIAAAVFDPAVGLREFLGDSGLLEGATQRMDRAVELWRVWDSPSRAETLVSQWSGTDRAETRACLARIRPFLNDWFSVLDAAVEQLRELGHPEPHRQLARSFHWTLHGVRDVQGFIAGTVDRFTLEDVYSFESDSVTVFAFRRR